MNTYIKAMWRYKFEEALGGADSKPPLLMVHLDR